MRKRYRRKSRSCALCKPHKRGIDLRWTPRDAAALADAERVIGAARRGSAAWAADLWC